MGRKQRARPIIATARWCTCRLCLCPWQAHRNPKICRNT